MAELVLDGIHKHFGETIALNALSLTLADGEFLVLLGPTGAGKTTTLRVVAGLEQPEDGSVWIGGSDMTHAAPAARDVAFVFQQYSLYPHYSVFDNLAFPLRSPLRRTSETMVQRRVEEIAGLLRIDSKLKNKASQLSGGEMQRVAIGRALVREPALFLMDEPLSSLDAKLREDLRVELKRIQRELGATILYVTHDQIEAMTLADRIGFIEDGRLIQIGPPREVYARPNSVHVARRLGSPQINLVPALPLDGMHPPVGTTTIGVRPEDVMLGEAGLPAMIEQVEYLGAETVVLLRHENQHLHALVSGRSRLHAGQSVNVSVDPEACLFFDADDRRLAV